MYRPRGLHWSALVKLLAHGHRIKQGESPHVFVCIADHYEPMHGKVPAWKQQERVRRWVEDYPKMAADRADSRGTPPQHSFFWPADEYAPEHVAQIAELCEQGFGDVEIHLHHDNDTAEGLRETLEWFKAELHNEHGLLRPNAEGRIEYGFIHGNWALDNSRADGRWCGVNNELTVLRETGCYADFTMPSAPSETQTRTINSIYYAVDDPHRPKSHDRGIAAQVGRRPPEEALLMVQGPLALDWSRRKHGFLPRLENGDLHGLQPPTPERLEFWMRAGVRVVGQPNWLFIKLHTHGAVEKNAGMLLGEPMRRFHESLARAAESPERPFHYYYVTAREMADFIHQAEQGASQPNFHHPHLEDLQTAT